MRLGWDGSRGARGGLGRRLEAIGCVLLLALATVLPLIGGVAAAQTKVYNSSTGSASNPVSLEITAPSLSVTTASLPQGTVGAEYSASLTASGGTMPYTWAVTSGTLPPGLGLDQTTGVISGTPTASVAQSFTVTATDDSTPAESARADLTIVVQVSATSTVSMSWSAYGCGQANATLLSPPVGDEALQSGFGYVYPGQELELQAAPASGCQFLQWEGYGPGSYTGTQDPVTIIVPSASATGTWPVFVPSFSSYPFVDCPGSNVAVVTVNIDALNGSPGPGAAVSVYNPVLDSQALNYGGQSVKVTDTPQTAGTVLEYPACDLPAATGNSPTNPGLIYDLAASVPSGYALVGWQVSGDAALVASTGSPATQVGIWGNADITALIAQAGRPAVVLNSPTITNMTGPPYGATVTLTGTLSATTADATVQGATCDWGDGSIEACAGPTAQASEPLAAAHTYDAPGRYTITVTATDDLGGKGSAVTEPFQAGTFLPPVVNIGAPTVNGMTATITETVTPQTSGATITAVTCQWGDGATSQCGSGPYTASHTYSQDGTYTISVIADDSNSQTGSASTTVTVGAASGSLTISVTGLPPGCSVPIGVTGPNGYGRGPGVPEGSPQTLTGLIPGVYTVGNNIGLTCFGGSYQYTQGAQQISVVAGQTAQATFEFTLVTPPPGGGTMAVSPSQVVAGSTGDPLTFTYTAATGGMQDGALSLTVPSGWTLPSAGPVSGYADVTASQGSVSVGGSVIAVRGVMLAAGQSMTITYGADRYTATAPTAPGTDTFTAAEASTATEAFANLAVSPVVTVSSPAPPPAGGGVSDVRFAAGNPTGGQSSTWTVEFTTSATGMLKADVGEIVITAPPGTVFPVGSDAQNDYSIAVDGATVGSPPATPPTQSAPNTVTLVLPVGVGANTLVQVAVDPVQNPPSGKTAPSTYSVATSADTQPTSPSSGILFGTFLVPVTWGGAATNLAILGSASEYQALVREFGSTSSPLAPAAEYLDGVVLSPATYPINATQAYDSQGAPTVLPPQPWALSLEWAQMAAAGTPESCALFQSVQPQMFDQSIGLDLWKLGTLLTQIQPIVKDIGNLLSPDAATQVTGMVALLSGGLQGSSAILSQFQPKEAQALIETLQQYGVVQQVPFTGSEFETGLRALAGNSSEELSLADQLYTDAYGAGATDYGTAVMEDFFKQVTEALASTGVGAGVAGGTNFLMAYAGAQFPLSQAGEAAVAGAGTYIEEAAPATLLGVAANLLVAAATPIAELGQQSYDLEQQIEPICQSVGPEPESGPISLDQVSTDLAERGLADSLMALWGGTSADFAREAGAFKAGLSNVVMPLPLSTWIGQQTSPALMADAQAFSSFSATLQGRAWTWGAGLTEALQVAQDLASGIVPVPATPTIIGMEPDPGLAGGSSGALRIVGIGLSGATSVVFGSQAPILLGGGSNFVEDALVLQVTPPFVVEPVPVTVTMADGTAVRAPLPYETIASGSPQIDSIQPSSGSPGATVLIRGSGFLDTTNVMFGDSPALSFLVLSDSRLSVQVPPGTGTVQLRVTTPEGVSSMCVLAGVLCSSGFTYGTKSTTASPTVTAVSPSSGLAAGGTNVTITGTNFTSGSTVDFGTVAATSETVNSSTSITATAPAGSGTVDVTMTTSNGTSATSSADQFTYTTTVTCSGAQVAVGSTELVAGATGTVPITVSQLPSSCPSLSGWQLTVAYNPSVISVTGATGGPMWPSITANTGTAGTVLLAGSQTGGVTGTQVIAELQVKAIGAAGTDTALTATVQSLTGPNLGNIGAETTAGSVQIEATLPIQAQLSVVSHASASHGNAAGLAISVPAAVYSSTGEAAAGEEIAGYQLSVSASDPTDVRLDPASCPAPFTGCDANVDQHAGTETVAAAVYQGATLPAGVAFIPVRLTGPVTEAVQVTTTLQSVVDQHDTALGAPAPVTVTLQRGAVYQACGTDGTPVVGYRSLSVADAVAALQYLVKLRQAGTGCGQVNPVALASLVPVGTGLGSTPSVADVVALLQYLVGLRGPHMNLHSGAS